MGSDQRRRIVGNIVDHVDSIGVIVEGRLVGLLFLVFTFVMVTAVVGRLVGICVRWMLGYIVGDLKA